MEQAIKLESNNRRSTDAVIEIEKKITAAIDIKNTTKIFGNDRNTGMVALDDVSLIINDNEFFTLLGPSGCGKTTLLRLIAGFEQPTEGEIMLFGSHLEGLPPHKRSVNTVFQQYSLFPHMTVAQNIAFGLEMLGKTKPEVERSVNEVLALVQMEHLAQRKIDQLSGGQQQRVALARALAPHPKVLLLDEPLSALDFKLRKEMQVELKRLQSETGITFIFVTHDQEEALTMSDRIAVMQGGHIMQVGTPHDIYNHPTRRFVADFIGDINILEGELLSKSNGNGKVKLDAGMEVMATLPKACNAVATFVSVAVRPEQLIICPANEGGDLTGTITNIIYFGSGSHIEVKLVNGELISVRQQSHNDDNPVFALDDLVCICFSDNCLQILAD